MSDSTNRSPSDKRQFYSQPKIAKEYDEQRFGGASGAWVSAREIELTRKLVTPFRRALDLGCGTGRLARELAQYGSVVGVDASLAMLEQARSSSPLTRQVVNSPHKELVEDVVLAQADAFALPFAQDAFDAVVALRVVFHFADVEDLLQEINRILAPRGVIVFDTYRWSLRAWLALDSARWGGGVFIHPPDRIEQIARRLGLRVAAREHAFLFSPYVYRRLPLAAVKLLERIEQRFPPRWRARVFWKLERE